jgi:hypothetical protein
MQIVYLILGTVFCVSSFLTACSQNPVLVSQNDTENDLENDSDQPVIWIGPGWYYGIWFNSEDDFHHWNHDHHDDHDHRNDNNDHRNRSRGAGGQHSGGHH